VTWLTEFEDLGRYYIAKSLCGLEEEYGQLTDLQNEAFLEMSDASFATVLKKSPNICSSGHEVVNIIMNSDLEWDGLPQAMSFSKALNYGANK
jgi:hypothetical protein